MTHPHTIRTPGVRRALAGLVLALAVLAPTPRADVLHVSPSGPFGDVGSAVFAATDGDVIVVAPGTYPGFDIVDTALSVVADGAVMLSSRVSVRDLAAGKLVVLQGFSNPAFGFEPRGLEIVSCAGRVIVDSVTMHGRDGLVQAHDAVSVRFSDAVTLSNSTFLGGDGAFCTEDFCSGSETLGIAGAGVHVRNSNVAVEHCTLVGGNGGSWDLAEPVDGGSGGPGLYVVGADSFVHVAGSVLDGGDGGFGDCDIFFCGSNGGGGAALQLVGDNDARVRDCELRPGTGAGSSVPGPEFQQPSGGTIEVSSTPAGALVVNSPVRPGDDAVFDLSGEPGALATLWLSGFAGFTYLPGREGVFHLGFPLALPKPVALGAFPVGGALQLALTVPELPGLPSINVHAQLVSVGMSGARLDGPTVLVVLDETP